MDTDGTIDKDGRTVTFDSTSKRLADDVAFLVRSLGGRAVYSSRLPKYTYKEEQKTGRIIELNINRMVDKCDRFIRSPLYLNEPKDEEIN